MRYLTITEENDFFRKYLALHGLDGNRHDYDQLYKWYNGHCSGIYPNILQRKYPLPVGKLYGYLPKEVNVLQLVMEVLDYNNYCRAIESYKAQIKSNP